MKKKLIVLAALVTIAATSAMANTEIDLNYYITPVISRNVNPDGGGKSTFTVPSFVGLEGNFNFMFGSNAGIFDMGLNMDTGVHAITGKLKTTENPGGSSESNDPYAGVGVFLSLGPVFRFTFTNIFSLSLIPGLQAEFDVAGYEKTEQGIKNGGGIMDFSVAASINAAAKLWFVNVTGYHMGLNLGVDLDFPFAGILGYFDWKGDPSTSSYSYTGEKGNGTYGGGMNFRIFAGIAFQFGDRAYDRQFNE